MELIDESKFISFKNIFPRLYEYIPGLIKGNYYSITAGTSVGKSKFAKYLFVRYSYDYCKKYNMPLKIIYFALEESEEKFWISMKCDFLNEMFNTSITYYQYKGFHEGMTDEIRKQLEIIEPLINDMKKIIHIEKTSNPTGIKKTIIQHLDLLGKNHIVETFKDKDDKEYHKYEYRYNNENTHVIVVIDHNILLSPEKNEFNDCSTTFLAMGKMSEYMIKLCDKYKIIGCVVHQQESNNENVNNIKVDNLQPTLSKAGMNKIITQDYHVVFGLFAPYFYKLTNVTNYKDYNIKEMFKNKFRELSILKHRDGELGINIPLYFEGRMNYFEELPLPHEKEKLKEIYKKLKN